MRVSELFEIDVGVERDAVLSDTLDEVLGEHSEFQPCRFEDRNGRKAGNGQCCPDIRINDLTSCKTDHLPRVRMAGLDPSKTYKIRELNRIDNVPLPYEGLSFSGKFLMENGLEIPLKHIVDYHKQDDWSSRVLYLVAD